MEKTTNYKQFKIIEENRVIMEKHVKRLMDSIKSRNLLEYKPIQVNANMEVIDGQHRLQAAQRLGIPIYYEIQKSLVKEDMVQLNIMRAWNTEDYLHYHVKEGKEDYIRFNNFIEKNKLPLKVACNIVLGQGRENMHKFKDGKFQFNLVEHTTEMQICWFTIDMIKRENSSSSSWIMTGKFWKALLTLIRHPHFELKRWEANINKLAGRVTQKVTSKEYLKLLLDIYNWRNNTPLDIETFKDKTRDTPQKDMFE